MKQNTKLFSLLVAVIICCSINSFAQSRVTYVGTNGTVYSNYRGAGEIFCKEGEEAEAVYCYQCRAFHNNIDYAYYNNRANCREFKVRAHNHCETKCGDVKTECESGANCGYDDNHFHYKNGLKCNDCKDYSHEFYNMNHSCDNCGGDYIVKYRANKVKVKCNNCDAKWKYYYNDYHSSNHYVYDKNEKVIVSYQD